jgi:hypothetical protein
LDDEKVVQDVNKIIKTFHQSIDPNLKHGTFENVVTINLFEKKNSSGTSGIWSNEANGNSWEKWSIKVNVHFAENEKETKQFRLLAEKQLRACLLFIASLNVTEIYHLPFLLDDKIVHSYKISVQNTSDSDSWTGLLKKMISDSAIPSILK